MREETRPQVNCVFCKQPITRAQRPSVQLENGDEMHIECWDKYDNQRKDKEKSPKR